MYAPHTATNTTAKNVITVTTRLYLIRCFALALAIVIVILKNKIIHECLAYNVVKASSNLLAKLPLAKFTNYKWFSSVRFGSVQIVLIIYVLILYINSNIKRACVRALNP